MTFIGATHEVTGSCTLVEACGKRLLVDYGMEQGKNIFENMPLPVSCADVDYVLLTHAHIDHSGLLPLLYKNGFRGKIFATEATVELCSIMLRDSAHIQEFEAQWRNRKAKRAGLEPFVPLYVMQDALGVCELFCPCPYAQEMEIAQGLTVRFADAGHLLGSASVELWCESEGVRRKLVFSGDIGNLDQPLLRDPSYIDEADVAVMESTYGDRLHGAPPDYEKELARIVQQTFDKGGNVVIPSFAVGRTQQLLYFLRNIKAKGLIKGHDGFLVYVDSPLAIEATKIFGKRPVREACFDADARALLQKGIDPLTFDGLTVAVTPDDSKLINANKRPCVILSASGMCEAGRIRHHLKHNLWRPECTVLFVGFQAVGTLGRSLMDGAKTVRLFGERIEVKAKIEKLEGASGHADHAGLLLWLKNFKKTPKKVFVVHGENKVCDAFTKELRDLGYSAYAPYSGARFDLDKMELLDQGQPVPVKPPVQSTAADPLTQAFERLRRVRENSAGRANKDILALAQKIQALCDAWEQ